MKKEPKSTVAQGPIAAHTALYKLMMRVAEQIVLDRLKSRERPKKLDPTENRPA